MSWKKYLEQFFSPAYFKHLLRRYLWLVYLPLAIYFGFVFLCSVLGVPLAALGILLFPYAIFIVPATALILFHVYTQKTEASHMFSMPITRVQNLVSAYLAGLTLILIPLMMMSFVYSPSGIGDNILVFLMGMFFLAIIYYSFSVLGCLLGGTLMTQLMMMGVISFGPLILYIIVNTCVSSLALGNIPSDLNATIINAFCPLISGASFIFYGEWPYWYIHVILLIGIWALSLYLVRIRPFELSGQSAVFAGTQEYLMRPILYLNAVYLIFFLCASSVFEESYFDISYYSKMVTLLAGTGILVAFIFNIWFSRDLKSLFSWKNIQQTFLMTLLACSLLLIPLQQKENSRKYYPKGELEVTLIFPGGRNVLSTTMDTDTYQRKIDSLLEEIDLSRNRFVTKGTYHGEFTCSLYLDFYSENNDDSMSQAYFILPEDINRPMSSFIRDFLISDRKEALDDFVNENYRGRYYQSTAGALYDRKQLAKAIEGTFSSTMPKDYFESYVKNAASFYEEGQSYVTWDDDMLFELYLRSLTTDDFETWMDRIYSEVKPVLSAEDIDEIYAASQSASQNGKFSLMTDTEFNEIFENSEDIELLDMSYWQIQEANDHYLKAVILGNTAMTKNVETDDGTYFSGNTVEISYEVTFDKTNGEWEMSIEEVMEVNY